MYCMYVLNMCTLYDITNVWNELECLLRVQPPLPLRRRHQHPDLPWWVLHSLVYWVCMLVTYILVCKYVCKYDVRRCSTMFTTFMLVRRWRCKSLRSWKATMRKVMQNIMHMMTTSTPTLLLQLILIQIKVSRVHDVCMHICMRVYKFICFLTCDTYIHNICYLYS